MIIATCKARYIDRFVINDHLSGFQYARNLLAIDNIRLVSTKALSHRMILR
jgi:hypothetical protein